MNDVRIYGKPEQTLDKFKPHFVLDDTTPQRVDINETTPEGHATKLYSVVADYGWAEKIVATDCYLDVANDIAWAIGQSLRIPYEVMES